jgi:hypothetical protein
LNDISLLVALTESCFVQYLYVLECRRRRCCCYRGGGGGVVAAALLLSTLHMCIFTLGERGLEYWAMT